MPRGVGRQPVRPAGQPPPRRCGQTVAQRLVADPTAEPGVLIAALRRQQRNIRVGPVIAELVLHLGHPPVQQRPGGVDRRHQPGRAGELAGFATNSVT